MRGIGLLLLGLIILLAGCGSSASGPSASSENAGSPGQRNAAPGPCRVGKSVLPHAPEAPALWKEGPGQPTALACLHDRRYGGAAIVGYVSPGAGSCVVTYNSRYREGFEWLCEARGTPWTVQCEGQPGCIHSFIQGSGFTELDGPLESRVRSIRVLVDGKPLESGVMVAHVEGSLARSIKAGEPFGYFTAFINRCVVPNQVKIEFLGRGGSLLGQTRGWDVVVPPCREASEAATAG